MTLQYTTSHPTRTAHYTLLTRSNISSFPLSSLHALSCFCLFFARLLFRTYTLWHTLLLASHTPSLFPSCRAARALSLPGSRTLLPGGRTLFSPATGLFPPRRQDSHLPGGRTFSSPAAGLSPPRRQDSHLPGGRTFSSPAAGLFPPRWQDSHLPGGRTFTLPTLSLILVLALYSQLCGSGTHSRLQSGPNTGSCRPLLLASSPILGCYFISMLNPGSEGLVRVPQVWYVYSSVVLFIL